MKKLMIALMVLAAFLMMQSVVMAQNPMKISKGFKVGLNMGNVTGDDADIDEGGTMISPSNRMGFSGGFFLGFELSPGIVIQPEIIYTQKGAEYEYEGMTMTMKVDYIAVPVLLKYKFTTPGNVKPFLAVGGELAFKSGAKAKIEYQGDSMEFDIENMKSTDFSLVVGGGVDLSAGSNTFFFDFRYVLGMSSIAGSDTMPVDFDGFWIEPDEEIKTTAIMFSAGMSF